MPSTKYPEIPADFETVVDWGPASIRSQEAITLRPAEAHVGMQAITFDGDTRAIMRVDGLDPVTGNHIEVHVELTTRDLLEMALKAMLLEHDVYHDEDGY